MHAASGGAYSNVTTGLRVQSAVTVVLLVVGCLVVRARAGLGRAGANWARVVIGPFVLVLALLALVVAASGGAWHSIHRRRRTLPSH